jgi:hypothetical protein
MDKLLENSIRIMKRSLRMISCGRPFVVANICDEYSPFFAGAIEA